jgi:pimeloyl-ACP methyl ester carboxylesterase
VLLHGGFGSWNHWYANLETLREERELWTVDLPGLGDSGAIHRGATVTDFARLLGAGIHTLLGERDYELAGFSFGAMVGARLAADSRCRRFTAIGAAGCGSLHVQVPLESPPPPTTPWEEAAPVHRANLRALMFSERATIDELAIYLHASNLARHRFNSRALSLSSEFFDALPDIRGRLVAVWGSADATAGDQAALASRRAIVAEHQPDATFHLLEGVGHWAMYQAPQAINAVLLT